MYVKYLKAVFCIFLVCVIFSGCSFRISSSIDDLISPISPFGDNADVQEALGTFAKNGYSLKTPSGGEFIASYNFFDIDKDGNEEAFAFYEPSDDLGTISMAVIKKLESKWTVVDNVKGDGKDIYSISFDDVNNDGNIEALICWDALSNSSNHIFSIYKLSGKNDSLKLKKIGDSIAINNYIVVDIDKSGSKELLLFEINGASSSVKAELYTIDSNSFKLLGETKLDSHITSYTKLQIEEAENDVRVYADAIGSDGSSMLTEIIYWSDTYDSIISPFYSYSTGLTKDTSRSVMITCQDVNGDGLIEIPKDYKIQKLPANVSAVEWQVYKNTTLVHAIYSLVLNDDRYMVVLPSNVFDKTAVSYNDENRLMTVKNKATKKTVFSIKPILKASYNEKDYSNYSIVCEASGYYYLAELGNDTDIKITIDDLKNYIKSID